MHFLQSIFSRYMLKGSAMFLYCINICRGFSKCMEPPVLNDQIFNVRKHITYVTDMPENDLLFRGKKSLEC